MNGRAVFRLLDANQSTWAILLSLVIVAGNIAFGDMPKSMELLFVAVVFSRYLFSGYVKSFDLALAVSILSLFAVPAALSIFVSQGEYVVFLACALLFADALRFMSERLNRRCNTYQRPLTKKFNIKLWITLMLIVVGGWHFRFEVGSLENVLLFLAPYGASLVIFERSLNVLSKRQILFVLFIYFVAIVYYSLFFWSGFGRLVISAYIMMPVLLINQHKDIGVRVWQLTLLVPFALVGAYFLRFSGSNLDNLMNDSWSTHLKLTLEMIDTLDTRQPVGLVAYLEQYSLIFFQWVPRSIWPTKPLGVGYTFVDDWLGRRGYTEGHSIALGFMGETLWYLGRSFIFGIVLICMTLISLRYFAATMNKGGYVLLSFVDSFLPSFFWGGMATYGSRFWFFLIPAIFTMYCLRFRLRRGGGV